MALNGIGGHTIAECQRNLTWLEVQRWEKYLAKRGSINYGERMEYIIANLCALVANKQTFMDGKGNIHGAMKKKNGAKYQPADFAPHADRMEEEDLTIDQILSVIKPPGKKKNG